MGMISVMGWTFTSLFTNANRIMGSILPLCMFILGDVGVIGGIYMIVTGLISNGKKQTSWPVAIILLLLGMGLAISGWGLLQGALNPNEAVGDLFNG